MLIHALSFIILYVICYGFFVCCFYGLIFFFAMYGDIEIYHLSDTKVAENFSR